MLNIKPYLLVIFLFGVVVSAQRTLIDVLQNTPELSSFNQYITSPANVRLYDLLSNANSSLTVFAPVNDAFDQLRQLITRSNIPMTDLQMSDALNFHVIRANLRSRDMNEGFQQYQTLYNTANYLGGVIANRPLTYDVPQDLTSGLISYGKRGNVVLYRGLGIPARVVRADISASNGIIHTIDQVLSPPNSIWDTLQLCGLTKIVDQIRLANARNTFQSLSRFTFLVPSNEAVVQFLDTHRDMTPDLLRRVLLSHVIPGYYFSQDLRARPSFKILTKSGEIVQISNDPQRGITIGDAVITTPDILSERAVFHVINKVLMPEQLYI